MSESNREELELRRPDTVHTPHNRPEIRPTVAILMIAAIPLAGCASTLKPNAITLTIAVKDEVKLGLAGTGTAVIDWGDGGIPETVILPAPNEYGRLTPYTHTFSVTTNRIIAIEEQNITHLVCDYGFELMALDVSRNIARTYSSCHDNWLTCLGMSKNIALT